MREPVSHIQRVAGIVAALALIPAGLAGIMAGAQGLGANAGNIGQAIEALQSAAVAALPWCQPAACLVFGLVVTAMAAGLLARGLQSGLR